MALKAAFPPPTTVPISSADARSDLAGLVVRGSDGTPRAGVLPRGQVATDLLSARATMSVSVAAFEAVLVRNGLPSWIRNDGAVTVAIGSAPSANSRIDLVWVKQNESESPFSDADNLAVFGVTPGQPTPQPIANFASVPAGALVLGQVTIPSTAVSTQSPGVVIATTAQFSAPTGSPVLVRSGAERDMIALAALPIGFEVARADFAGIVQTWNGTFWRTAGDLILPASVAAGAGSFSISNEGTISFDGVSSLSIGLPDMTGMSRTEGRYRVTSMTTGDFALVLVSAGAPIGAGQHTGTIGSLSGSQFAGSGMSPNAFQFSPAAPAAAGHFNLFGLDAAINKNMYSEGFTSAGASRTKTFSAGALANTNVPDTLRFFPNAAGSPVMTGVITLRGFSS